MSVSTLIVSQALIQHQDGVSLHPDLLLWEKQLASYRQRWFHCAAKNPLGWYAALCETSPAALLMQQCKVLPQDMSQCWVVSPYHAQLVRTAVRVIPEGQMPWTAEDADDLCETLNPFLAEDGMQLLVVDAALLLICREPMDAYPQSFGEISGHSLPDSNHAGEDGCRLNRLLSEIQMLLFQHPSEKRHAHGQPEVSGLWLWAPAHEMPSVHAKNIAVATRNPVLQSIVDGRDADLMISEAERMSELIQPDAPLPKRIVLSGEGYAVRLTKSWLPKPGKTSWVPGSVKEESGLMAILRQEK